MSIFIKKFSEISFTDLETVGIKNASLGKMFNQVSSEDIVSDGFAITSDAFHYFLKFNSLEGLLKELMDNVDRIKFVNLKEMGWWARKMIMNGRMPPDLCNEVKNGYKELCSQYPFEVAVRSSPVAEELPNESFIAQHETYLNLKGEEDLIVAVKKCFASLYTNRAIRYREENGIEHHKVAMSVGIQRMERSKPTNNCTFNFHENMQAFK